MVDPNPVIQMKKTGMELNLLKGTELGRVKPLHPIIQKPLVECFSLCVCLLMCPFTCIMR